MPFRPAAALALLTAAAFAVAAPPAGMDARSQSPGPASRAELLNLGLRGVYFVENQGQWGDESVHYGLKSRGLDVAFRESSFTMHLSREVSGDVPVAVARGAWASRPYESELVEWASRPYESELVEWASRPYESAIAPEASPTRERGLLAFDDPTPLPDGRGSLHAPVEHEHLTLTITFPGSNPVTPRGAQPQAAKFNYFVGGEGRGIASNVPSFGAVIYENLYDGIDLHVTGNDDGVMKYEFHCAPGADYSQIRIHYDGIDSLCVNDEGDLEIATSFGTLRDGAPIVWQEDDDSTSRARKEAELDAVHDATLLDRRGSSSATRTTLSARFELIDATTYRITLDATPDPSLPLVIDPEIEWMHYLGGSNMDEGFGGAVDSTGSTLVTGRTRSLDFNGRNNSHHGGDVMDVFTLKVSASGQLQWMIYLGGGGGDGGAGIALDSADNALVTGYTSSTDFAGRSNSFHGGSEDAFALSVSASGQLLWMIYLGGSGADGGVGIALDSADNALLTGKTNSTDFAGHSNSFHGGSEDAFALSVSASGQLQGMTYLGGSGADGGVGIALDSADNVLVTGDTSSTDFAGRVNSYYGGSEDGFVVKVSPTGALLWMTYLGGGAWDEATGIAVDRVDNVLVTGQTMSSDFAGRNNSHNGGNWDVYALRVGPSGQLQWMTYLGGSSNDAGHGIAADNAGNALVTGDTTSIDFAGRNNSYQTNKDAFALKVGPVGVVEWMTYLGGTGADIGQGIALDGAGNALVTGITWSTDFTGRNSFYHGNQDAFVVKLRLADGPQLSVAPTCPSGGPIRIEWSGATPGGQAALIYARNTGSFIIPNNRPCAGTELGLGSNQIQLAWQGGAGANGSRTLNTTAGPGACGGYLQLLDLTTCSTSNVARIE